MTIESARSELSIVCIQSQYSAVKLFEAEHIGILLSKLEGIHVSRLIGNRISKIVGNRISKFDLHNNFIKGIINFGRNLT